MIRKVFISITLFACATVLFGCGNAANKANTSDGEVTTASTAEQTIAEDTEAQENSEETDEENADSTKQQENTEETQNETVEEQSISLQEELDAIEAKSIAFDEDNWDIPQQEMNTKSEEWYKLWDDELNALWNRLEKTLSEDKMTELQQEQVAWVKRKEQNVCAAGIQAYGGSMQPLLENTEAREITRARAYVLAQILAEAKQETFTLSEAVQNSTADVDISLDSVFEALKGEYNPTPEVNVTICPLSESDFTADNFPEGTKWVFFYSHSDVLTEGDIYAYAKDALIFEKGDIYYVIQKGMEGDVMTLSVGSDLANLEYVGELK